jgi:predicted MFS family arabinose efflux permease
LWQLVVLSSGAAACVLAFVFLSGRFWPVVALVWIILFLGAATVPGATGLFVASVPGDMRSLATAVSVFFYNAFGYFLAPVISGWVTNATGSYRAVCIART